MPNYGQLIEKKSAIIEKAHELGFSVVRVVVEKGRTQKNTPVPEVLVDNNNHKPNFEHFSLFQNFIQELCNDGNLIFIKFACWPPFDDELLRKKMLDLSDLDDSNFL